MYKDILKIGDWAGKGTGAPRELLQWDDLIGRSLT